MHSLRVFVTTLLLVGSLTPPAHAQDVAAHKAWMDDAAGSRQGDEMPCWRMSSHASPADICGGTV